MSCLSNGRALTAAILVKEKIKIVQRSYPCLQRSVGRIGHDGTSVLKSGPPWELLLGLTSCGSRHITCACWQ